jgi:hypothetical protein
MNFSKPYEMFHRYHAVNVNDRKVIRTALVHAYALLYVTPSQSTNKTFWISVACGNCSQNIPSHPVEKFPNTTLPVGPGLVLRPPNKVGA